MAAPVLDPEAVDQLLSGRDEPGHWDLDPDPCVCGQWIQLHSDIDSRAVVHGLNHEQLSTAGSAMDPETDAFDEGGVKRFMMKVERLPAACRHGNGLGSAVDMTRIRQVHFGPAPVRPTFGKRVRIDDPVSLGEGDRENEKI